MKQFFQTFAGVLAGLFAFFVAVPVLLFLLIMILGSITSALTPARSVVLALDLRQEMTDQRSLNPFAALGGGRLALLDVLERLEAAREDESVKGIYIRANTDGMAPAQAEELRAALAAFRAEGKFVVAHLQPDSLRVSLAGYATVAGADELWLQDASEFQAMGLSSQALFLGETLRRFRVQAQFEQREEYKNAPNQLTEAGFTPSHREATLGLLNGVYDVLTRAIAEDRELTQQQVQERIAATPVTGARAVELGLIDRMGRPEDAEAAALARAEGATMLDFDDYRPPPRVGGPVIAVVAGEGGIVSGRNEVSPFGEGASMNSDAVAEALLDAAEDDNVRAIVFRVSSGGGSVVASDQILNALRMAKARGKKIVVSMGEVAASGGYYVAVDADEIVASATTITGSIGVFGGKLVIGPAMEHYAGVRTETLSLGSPMVSALSADEAFTREERAAFAAFVDRTYATFLALVAEGRGLTPEQAHAAAHGRVWTGAQAAERGLVDHLGGFATAIARARALAEIEEGDRVRLRFYPSRPTTLQAFEALLGSSGDAARAAALLSAVAEEPALAALVAQLNGQAGQARAEAPPLRIR